MVSIKVIVRLGLGLWVRLALGLGKQLWETQPKTLAVTHTSQIGHLKTAATRNKSAIVEQNTRTRAFGNSSRILYMTRIEADVQGSIATFRYMAAPTLTTAILPNAQEIYRLARFRASHRHAFYIIREPSDL